MVSRLKQLQIAFVQILGNGDFAVDTINFDTTSVPEPASLLLVGLAMLGLFGARTRRQ
jgi:PEP-CTERM motif